MATVNITDVRHQSTISSSSQYRAVKIKNSALYRSTIKSALPFRIKLTNITIPGYGPSNIPGIGLQVIGYSNYIL